MTLNQTLLENVQEFKKESEKAKADNAYNSAVTLCFKAVAVLVDLFLLKKEGFIPKNHTERFEILRAKHKQVYLVLDKIFPLYQQSYRLKMGLQQLEVIENEFRKLAEITGIDISNKKNSSQEQTNL